MSVVPRLPFLGFGSRSSVVVYQRQKGFTLIELLIVVMIIGIIAAIAVPNLILALERSRQRRTMADMRNMATAWEARNTETNRYNAAGAQVPGIDQLIDVNALGLQLSPTYIKVMPSVDGWGHPFRCFTNQSWGAAAAASAYAIISAGKGGVFASTETAGATTSFDCDIVYSNGAFLQYPEGAQLSKQ